MKKLIVLFFCFILGIICVLPVSAEDTTEVYSTYRFGDVDGNTDITAADARLCLRAAAKLDVLEQLQSNAADVNGDGVISSSDARMILRASANIEPINARVGFMNKINSTVVIGPLKNAGSGAYNWVCTVEDENAVKVESYNIAVPPSEADVADGAPVQQYFEITILETGDYNVAFELKNSWENDAIDQFSFDIWCYYTGLL